MNQRVKIKNLEVSQRGEQAFSWRPAAFLPSDSVWVHSANSEHGGKPVEGRLGSNSKILFNFMFFF